uniref:Uncharacterized protein n=1 Tax=Anguilla anguilla TaxID=7936 RepID=A0A0E9PBU0_ANGAN
MGLNMRVTRLAAKEGLYHEMVSVIFYNDSIILST